MLAKTSTIIIGNISSSYSYVVHACQFHNLISFQGSYHAFLRSYIASLYSHDYMQLFYYHTVVKTARLNSRKHLKLHFR